MRYRVRIFTGFSFCYYKKWWQSLDKCLLTLLAILFAVGVLTSFLVPMDVQIINIRYFLFAVIGICVFFGASMLSVKWVQRVCILGAICVFVALVLLPFIGIEYKGATRWLPIIGGQPSEFAKPIFAVVSAWLFRARFYTKNILATGASFCLFLIFAGLILIQPDLGQTLLFSSIWGAQVLVAGASWLLIILLVLGVLGVIFYRYVNSANVRDRFEALYGECNYDTTYQTCKAIEAFESGGFKGQGLGSRQVIDDLPDVHTDFIFAVYAEKIGIVLTGPVFIVFVIIIVRMVFLILNHKDIFCMIAMVGICGQFSVQTLINIASTTRSIPTTGMTLPLISMGGSSYVAIAGALGLFMALSRRRKYQD